MLEAGLQSHWRSEAGRRVGVHHQRPQNLHKTIIAQADIGVFFKLTSDRDKSKADDLAETFDAEDVAPESASSDGDRRGIRDRRGQADRHGGFRTDLPHVAGDDGKANDKWVSDGETVTSDDLDDVDR